MSTLTTYYEYDDLSFYVTDAAINPAIGPATAADKSVKLTPFGSGLAAATVFGPTMAPIPPGLLFTVDLDIDLGTPPGTYELSTDGALIKVTDCNGDCDGNDTVSIGEVQRCVNKLLGHLLCDPATPALNCPVADANGNGAVSIGEVQDCANHLLAGCGQ